jgi:hypothetical protein
LFPSPDKRVRRHLLIGFSIGPSSAVVSACYLPKMGTNPVSRTWDFNLCFKHGMMKKAHTVNDSKSDVLSLESYRIVLDTYQLGDTTNTLHLSTKSTYLNALCRKDAWNVFFLIFSKKTVNKVIESDQCVDL